MVTSEEIPEKSSSCFSPAAAKNKVHILNTKYPGKELIHSADLTDI